MIRAAVISLIAAAGVEALPNMLVSTEWLASHLNDPTVVVLHVGSQKDYEAGHIPGARLVTLPDISVAGPAGLRLQLPPAQDLVAAFGKLGVSDDSRVIVYAGTDSVQSATRVWFTLDYLGLGDRSSLLDGGLSLWRTEGRTLSTDAPVVKATRFTARPRPDAVVDAAWLASHLKDPAVRIIDARTPEFYSGENAGGMPRAGHLPGAASVPYTTLLDESRRFKPALDGKGKTIVTYCHIGQQATVPYFVARLLGYDVKLYDGSFQDWSARADLPVETSGR